jgi:hypothetical protein
MKKETIRKVENFMFGMQTTLYALDELQSEKFYSKEIKYYGNLLIGKIEAFYNRSFGATNSGKGVEYYASLMDWLTMSSDNFSKFNELSEEEKVKYLMALDNFNTINLRSKRLETK